VPATLIGDELRLRQVIANLLENAVKFTEGGEVALAVALSAQLPERRIRLHCTVRDTGIGIAPEKQKSIFEPFRQADSSTTRRFGGTGLGLHISSRLVESMSGRIWVESQPGRGTRFHFTVEFGLAQERGVGPESTGPAAQEVSSGSHPGLRILLAEDNHVNQVVAARLLEKRGHEVTVAEDGSAVLRAFEAGSFDVILMDVHMPGMDGLEVTARIRESEQALGHPRLPIIAMTASAMQSDREKCLAAGMDDYVSKPIRPQALFRCLENAS
jgi:CheY-like chemotaxis protein/anti-sigma regulatory factor (Ser/Thr protein kinase)